MWNPFSVRSNTSEDDLPSQSTWRNNGEQRQPANRSASITSATSNTKSSSRADDLVPRGVKSAITSYSSTAREQRSGAALASRLPSYAATSENNDGEPHRPHSLARNVRPADQMPKSTSSRSSRDQEQARKIRDKKQGRTERSDARDRDAERRRKRDKQDRKDKDLRRTEEGLGEEIGSSRGPADFSDQVASSEFSQFPGQYDGAMPAPNGAMHEHPPMSSHVQDQFPGQFPTQSSAPYRPPLAASEGGPGLAAEYYGDAGQSVAEQPGNRVNTPSLIIGAEPHLQPALAVAAPPPEPSASGAVGAAASFFSGEFEEHEIVSSHGQQNLSTYVTGQIRPNSNHHSSSAPVVPTIGGAVIGSAAGYLVNSQNSLQQQHPHHESSIAGDLSEYSSIAAHQLPSTMQGSQHSSSSQPTRPGKQSSQLSSNPIYAAGLAGTAGWAAAANEHNNHSSNVNHSSTSQYSTTSTAQRHHNRGPLSALVNFFKDPEGVAQFEEYSQIIGVCRHCFAPGSSSRDAPRKHFYGRRRSHERFGSSTRVDKDNRYYSSENEGRRKNKSWVATGLAGYGLAKVGESLFNEKDDFDDTNSVKNGRFPSDGRDRRARRRSRSKEHIEMGITFDSKSDRKRARDAISNSTKTTIHSTRRRSRTRSRSKDRKDGLSEAIVGAALGASVAASSSRPQSNSPHRTFVKSKRISQASSPERRHETKKKRSRGFFSFGNGSSSSSSVDLAYTDSQNKHRSSERPIGKSKDDKKAEAALLGLGAAAAALALNDGRQSHRKKGVKEHARARESRDHDGHGSSVAHRTKKSSGSPDDELWESAAEDDYESINSDLAYGAPVRRDSRASSSSESSGTNKWGWRWGSKKHRRASSPRQKSSDHNKLPAVATVTGANLTGPASMSPNQHQGSAMTSTSSFPLQHVFPVPTSDPSRFDVGSEATNPSSKRPAMSSRPEAVPLQHPRPIAPVSAAIYSSQTAYDHSYSAPTGVAVFSHDQYRRHPEASRAQSGTHEASIPSNPRFEQQADDMLRDSKIRRRDTSPARFGADSISSSMAPRRRNSAKDDSSVVRFDLTEEQEERDRRERRRKRKQDKERREAEEQEQNEKERRATKEGSFEGQSSKPKPGKGPEKSEKPWVGPIAAGIVGAAIGSAAVIERSRSEETREERRERRRRERELEDEEDTLIKSERRRRQRERDDQEAAINESGKLPDEVSASSKNIDEQGRSIKKREMSVWQEAASTKRSSSHENYGAFFTPLELLNKSSDQVKITSANADADIDVEQVPHIVTVEPKRTHELSDSPTFSFADIDDKVEPSRPSFPWQVPRLRLVEPTPPSTRASTPLLQPKNAADEGFEEPRKDGSPSKVKWADDQNREYTIISPNEDVDEFVEPLSGETSGTDLVAPSGETYGRESSDLETNQPRGSNPESSSVSYGDDVEFAATLAASAEDAGFDPSIVIENPTYRCRDSPPGSNERGMPGGFEDDEPQLKKKERKRKKKSSRSQSQINGPNGRDDDRIVQDIISEVHNPGSEPLDKFPLESIEDGWKTTTELEYDKSGKRRKASESGENLVETSDLGNKAFNLENHDVYRSRTEDVRSITSSSNEAESDQKSREEFKHDISGFDDPASNEILPSTTESSKSPKPNLKDKSKGSLWDRFLGKSTNSLSQQNVADVVTEQASIEGYEEARKKSTISEEPKPTDDRDDNYGSKERDNTGRTTPQLLDRLPVDLSVKDQGTSLPLASSNAGSVAKYLDHGEWEQVEEKQPKSFLGMRPEPPPPPDIDSQREEQSTPLKTTSLPTSPCEESETKIRRFSDAEISNKTPTTSTLPSSPTAVPFHFRRPARSPSTARSLSQAPVSSNQSAADPIPKLKTRPRSTEFKSSKEIRPLWLVERHRSHQEPVLDEVYPSLPSSHTTSRSASVIASEEREHHPKDEYEIDATGHELIEIEPAPIVSTQSPSIQTDLIDSQQVTPTASSFHHPATALDMPFPQSPRGMSPEAALGGGPPDSSSAPKSGIVGAILGGSAAVAINETTEQKVPLHQGLPQEEDEDFERGFNDIGLDTMTYPSQNDNLDQEDFSLSKAKKAKKSKRKAGQSQQGTVQPSPTKAAQADRSTEAVNSGPLSPEAMRQIQEQDAQDAVDSWFPSVRSSTKAKRGKKGKTRMLVKGLTEESGRSPDTHEPPGDNRGIAVSVDGQEKDSLTREMSHKQVVDIMTAVAQDADKDGDEALQSATVMVQAPAEIWAQEHRTEPKATQRAQEHLPKDDLEQDHLPQDNLNGRTFPSDDIPQENSAQDDLPQDNLRHDELLQLKVQQEIEPQDGSLPVNAMQDRFSQSQEPRALNPEDDPQPDSLPALSSSSALAMTSSIDAYLEEGHSSLLQSPKNKPVSEELDRSSLIKATSPQLELSPRATPLPDSDDEHDLLVERLRTPIPTPSYLYDNEGNGVAAEDPLDASHIYDPSAIALGTQGQLQDLPTQADQIYSAAQFAVSSKTNFKEDKSVRESFSVEDNEIAEIQRKDSQVPGTTPPTLEDDWLKGLDDGPAIEVPQGKSQTVEDESGGLNHYRKGETEEEASQNSSAQHRKPPPMHERQELPPQMAASEVLEDKEALKLIDESAVDVFQPQTEFLVDKSAGFNDNEPSQEREEIKPRLLMEKIETTNLGVQNGSLSKFTALEEPDYNEGLDLVGEPAIHVPDSGPVEEFPRILRDEPSNQAPKPKMPEDEGAGFDSKTSKPAENQGSQIADLEPEHEQTEYQPEQRSDAKDDLHDRASSLAMTWAGQEVSTRLGLGDIGTSVENEPKENFPNDAQAERNLQRPSEGRTIGRDDLNLPMSVQQEIAQFEYAPGKADDDERSSALDKSVTSTNAAQVVQDILAGEKNAESATDANSEAMAIPTGTKDARTDSLKKENGSDWDTLKKKKKGKKGKKNEAFSWEEPETLQPADASSQNRAVDPRLEQEPVVDRRIEEDELDRDASKKKKGKKGKKNEAFLLGEPKVMEPVKLSDPPFVMEPPLIDQEAAAEANDEVFPRQPKKDKRNKKGKKKGTSRVTDDFRDEDEPNVVSIEFPQDESSLAIASGSQEGIKASDIVTQSSQNNQKAEELHMIARDRSNEVEPDFVSTETLHDDQVEDRAAIDHPLVTSVVREELGPPRVTTKAPPDSDSVEDHPADANLQSEAENIIRGVTSKTVVATDSVQDDKNRASREASLEREEPSMPPNGKKDKKKSKKSKKSNPFSLDNDRNLRRGDGQIAGAKGPEKGETEQATPFGADVVVESEKSVSKTNSDQKDDFMQPTKKKNKKKSKKYTGFSLDNDVVPALEDEPASRPKILEDEEPKETFPSDLGVVKEPGANVEAFDEKSKDQDETEEAQPDTWKSEDPTAPLEPVPGQDIKKDSGIDSSINSTKVWGDHGMLESKGEQPMHGGFDSTSVHAATPEALYKLNSSVTSSLEQPANVPEETLTDQAKELEGNIHPLVMTEVDSLSSSKPSKKDKKKAKKAKNAQAQIWENDEVSQEPTADFNTSGASEDVGEPPINSVSQRSEPWSESGISARQVEFADEIQQNVKSGEDRSYRESLSDETPSHARDDLPTIVEVDQNDSFANAENGKKSERFDTEEHPVAVEEDGCGAGGEQLEWTTATSPVGGSEQTLDVQPRGNVVTAAETLSDHDNPAVGCKEEQIPILPEPGAVAEAKDEDLTRHMPVKVAEQSDRPQEEAQRDEPSIEDQSLSVAPEPAQVSVESLRDMENVEDVEQVGNLGRDGPTPTMEFGKLDANELREYNEKYAKEPEQATLNAANVADPEPVEGLDTNIDKPIPAIEVEMLDPQEQQNYNEEYEKELERQLSPLQEGGRDDCSRDEVHTPVFSPSSTYSVVERPYEEEHRPLARPPALEDIIEEPGSRPGSFQDSPVDREDDSSPIKSNKKGKRAKRAKKQQPVIWEDETATPPLEPESTQAASRPSADSSSWTMETARPLGLEELVHQQSFEDRTIASHTRDFNTTGKESETQKDQSDDYFAIQPSRPAEEDIGGEDTQEFRRALAAEPPYASEDQFPAQDTQRDQEFYSSDGSLKADNQDKGLAPLGTDSYDNSRTELKPVGEHVEDEFDPAPIEMTDKGTRPDENGSVREPTPHALEQADVMDPKILTVDNLNERSPSRQYSSQHYSHKDKLSSAAEARSTSRGKPESTEGVAATVGLSVGALAAESLSGEDSEYEMRHGENAKEVGNSSDLVELEDALDNLDKGEIAAGQQEGRRTPDPESPWQHDQPTPRRSPSSASHSAVAGHPVEENLGKSSETPEYRDSAIYVSGSPMISEEMPHHHAARDSGYPDTEASPTIDDKFANLDTSRKLEKGLAANEKVGHVRPPHSGAREIERQRSTSGSPREISVEGDSDYDVSESTPRDSRKRSRRRSGVTYDSDDSADSGFDVQRRRRRQAMATEAREPSPVSSTTKDRSSALFDSSPSAREEIAAIPQDRGLSPVYNPVGEKPNWSFDRGGSPQQRSRELSREGRSGNTPENALEATGYSISTDHHEARGMSLFGGPQNNDDDLMSPSRSPRSSEGRGRRRLNTIPEGNADGSPLQRKDKRALSDVGSPESGVKGRRMRSPAVEGDVAGEYVSTHDPISRLPWLAAEEEKGRIWERSRSRNSDQLSNLSSRHSGRSGAAFGDREAEHRTASAGSMRSQKNHNPSIHAIIRTPPPPPDQVQVRSASGLSYRSSGTGTATPPLRRVDRSASGDLRGASKNDEAKSRAKKKTSSSELKLNEADVDFTSIPSSSTYDPVTHKGKSPANMTDVYEGWGDVRGQSPMSPTRPPSMRKRQSMQLLDLETRLDQLVSENRLLASQKLTAEHALQEQARDHSQERHAYENAIRDHKTYLTRKDSELNELKKVIEHLQDQAAHLTDVNEELASSRDVHKEYEQRYLQLQTDHAHTHEQWQQSTRELENLKEQHTQLSTGMEDIVRHEVTVALEEKNIELRRLQNELENAKQQVRELQQQLLASRSSDDFVERDEDYFDSRCQSLCQHVQQWVLRFSKFSDMKACYLAREIQDEKVVDRMENAILDGSDVDSYLSDRVKRRDVFMSVVMTMIWEFIFTRYLFGMDREQRQKLKNLEKTLQEVGPISAVHKWRATTLNLLMKREAFENQRATDTEAVVHEIYDTLATFLPPPSPLVGQIQDSLRKVIDAAVDLSIEMRTQRAEYSMLPPLQPEYDTNGDLARKVYFSALTMNERSGATSSNEALQEQQAVVRMVLFPLVVKNEDDDEQIVVCPAQVLTAEGSKGKKTVRVLSAQGGRSEASFAGSDVRMEGGMI